MDDNGDNGDDIGSTRRRAHPSRSRVDMGLTLVVTKRGRKTLLTDAAHATSTSASADINEIIRLSAAVDLEDKENNCEEAIGPVGAAGQSVYGFQKRSQRGRGGNSISVSANARGTRGRGRGRGGAKGSRGRGAGSSATKARYRERVTVEDIDEDENDEDEDEDDGDDEDVNEDSVADSQDDGENIGDGDDIMEVEEDEFGRNGPAYERYFQDLHTTKGSKTSNNTLSKLPPLSQAECRTILAKVRPKHERELETLEQLHRREFKQWYFELTCGFNIIFYGYGSKRRIMNMLATHLATDAPAVIVNGYFPTLNFKQTLEKIISEVIGFSDTTGTIADLASLIHGYFESDSREVDKMYIVVHNIDGPCLRKHQGALAVLADCKRIHMLASIDHIEAPLIWDSSMITRFNWAWHDLTTFESYTVEMSYENYGSESTEIGPRGVLHVLASLTENVKSIFRILAEYQIAESVMDDAASGAQKRPGAKAPEMPYNGYFAACRDQFLVSSEMTFRSQLTEFRDHKVIQSRHATDGTEFVHIPLDAAMLETILESMD
ncbi:Origin recognition complex subunit 2 [Kickxella alabastrina]|uniref:Origin recognition complex subunit 2 n=1 Tax=Kickxella alabastrina TaxID=61397 RepID=A0ACC1I4A0_9FUNG|nr:Origin recognition complex subunit 2 [Kickxella alabastrina]